MKMEEYFAPQYNFLGLDEEYSKFDSSMFLVLPVGYDATTSYMPGARFGPDAVIKASRMVETYDEELDMNTYENGIYTFPPMAVDVSGPESMMKAIGDVASQIVKTGKTLITIGGEHSITFPIVNSLKKYKKQNFGVLQFDAHSDFRQDYEGTKFSHACVMKRVSDIGCPVFQVGIRSVSVDELPDMKSHKVKTWWMRDIIDREPEKIAMELIKKMPQDIYITIDLDVFDPSIMPATGTPEPGGMLWYQMMKMLRPIMLSKNIIGMDFVELAPIPGLVAPDFMTAKLIYRCMGYIAKNKKR